MESRPLSLTLSPDFLTFGSGDRGESGGIREARGCGLAAAAWSRTSRPRRAAGLTGRVGGGRRAGRWPRAAAPAPWLCPREPGELLLPRGVRAVMIFLPPTSESSSPLARTLALATTCESQTSEERPGELGAPARVDHGGRWPA
ncbi:uncharacterized protein [Bos taurus]|uniref:uncharacterized protein isoform X2 n=1 Tax=Bos taurus TaxID=9913 RepID=UPI000D533D19|nr:uncharacterized protein LOC104976366 isoform X2 [Bos taurus]